MISVFLFVFALFRLGGGAFSDLAGQFCGSSPEKSVGHRAGESEPGPTTKKNKWDLRVVLAST